MPDLFEGNFYIQVQNAANPQLGQNGQGVCGVVLQFDHEFVGDLLVTLTSPAGQTVTLMGPTGFFGETDGSHWDITFVPCNSTAKPDPGFSDIWNNDQPWGIFGSYTGSYYPFAGCLEDFNQGPVNGQWTLSVSDELFNDTGNFYNYQIIFCDGTNIECISCEANAGNLLEPDANFCTGDSSLNLHLAPTYPPFPPAPPASDYAYTYVIAAGGIIVGYEPGPDLRNYPAGLYTVCGLSYLIADADSIPPPDSMLTITELAATLNSATPPFCGKMTPNCININILPIPPDVLDTAMVCAPACYTFHDSVFCESGEFTLQLQQNSCSYTATLHLTVLQPDSVEVKETICSGFCAQTPGFESYCSEGQYTIHFSGTDGCDSVVTLNLSVLEAKSAILTPPSLSCGQSSLMLQGSGSTPPGPGISYQWTAGIGGSLLGPTNQINATAGTPGAYQLKVCRNSAGFSCCDSSSVTVLANLEPPETPSGLTGPTQLCAGAEAIYQIVPVSNASNYTWSFQGDAIPGNNPDSSSITLTWNNAILDTLCVIAGNACGNSAPACLAVEIMPLPAQPIIAGPDTVCTGDTAQYSVYPISNTTKYTWQASGGTIFGAKDSAVIQVVWNPKASNQAICVVAKNTCGSSPYACMGVTVRQTPAANAGNDTIVCGRSATLNALLSLPNSSGFWAWENGGGVLFSDSSNTNPVVTVDTSGIYIFHWTEQNGLCTNTDSTEIRFNPIPVTGPATPVCSTTNETYTVEITITGGAAPYLVNDSLLTGALFISGEIPSGAPYSFAVTDTNGCAAAVLADTFTCTCTTFAGQMSAMPLTTCAGLQVQAQFSGGATLDGNDTLAFALHTGPSTSLGQLIALNNTGIFDFQSGMVYDSTYYISTVAGNNINGLPDLNDPCLSVSTGQPVLFHALPIADAGIDTAVCGETMTMNASSGAGEWTYSAITTSGTVQFTDPKNPKTLITGNQPGMYSFAWIVTDNGCTASDTVLVQLNPEPSLSYLEHLCDSLNEQYTVSLELDGGTLPYTINGTQVLNQTFTSGPIPSGGGYSFTISDSNKCSLPEISGAYSCDCATDAGTMSQQLFLACETDSVAAQANNDLLMDGNDLSAFVLHTNSGPALGQILTQNKSGVFGFLPTMEYDKTYYVSRVAGNGVNGLPDPADPCFSVSPGQPVRFVRSPSPTAIQVNPVCGYKATLDVSGSVFSGKWSLQTGLGNAVFSAADSPSTQVLVATAGTYTFQWMESNGLCSNFANVTVIFFDNPIVSNLKTDCNDTNTGFFISFDLNKGTPPYMVDGLGGTFSNSAFVSQLLNNGAYAFTVTDANGCTAMPVSGIKECSCSTNAGTMAVGPGYFCAGQPATAVWNNDGDTDGDDIIKFILHDDSTANAGNIFAVNDQPVFPFAPGWATGVTYYISAIAGNEMAGSVDINDPCLSVAPGAPVQWKPLPLATLSGDTTICAGQHAVLHFSGTGTYPLDVKYTSAAGTTNSITIFSPQEQNIGISPTDTTIYTLVSVTDGVQPTCTSLVNDSVVIGVDQPVYAGTAAAPLQICSNSSQIIHLANLLNGASAGGIWSETSFLPSGPGGFHPDSGEFNPAEQSVGAYLFQYRVQSSGVCPDDSTEVSIEILPAPVADAGVDMMLDCLTPIVKLGDSLTGTGLDYQWLLNGIPIPGSGMPQIAADTAGIYTLLVTNQFGCSATDEVDVWLAAPPLSVPGLRIVPIRCAREENGKISVDSVSGGTPPYLYALNGREYGAARQFSGLPPGVYILRIQDAAGCAWSSDSIIIVEPAEIKINLSGDTEAALGDSLHLKVETSLSPGAVDTIIWNPLIDPAAAGQAVQHFLPLHSGKIFVTIIDTNGCFGTAMTELRVTQGRRVYIPNIFKPASDKNPVFLVGGGSDVEKIELFQIFDRWGELVFESRQVEPNEPTGGWDGTLRGKASSPGVYLYRIAIRFIDGEKETYTGTVTLLR